MTFYITFTLLLFYIYNILFRSLFYMHNLHLIITLCIAALLNGLPILHLSSVLTTFYINNLLICALSWLTAIHKLLSTYYLFYIHNPYFIITLRITALVNGLPTLHSPSTLPSFCMDDPLSTLSPFYIHSLLYALPTVLHG